MKGGPCVLVYVIAWVIGLTAANATQWICYQTVCEKGVHFCNHAEFERRCSRCEDFSRRCFTDVHQPNCTVYCNDLKERQLKDRDCGSVPDISNGSSDGRNISYSQGTYVTYSCNDGFAIKGLDNIQCREYGQWTIPPTCEGIICPVESIKHGRIVVGTTDGLENAESVPDGYIHGVMNVDRKVKINLRFGETATIVCDEGYRLHGTGSITCTQHGYLRVPLCMLVELDCQCEVWKILFGGSFCLHGFMIVGVLVYCWYRKPWKSMEYGPIKGRDDFEIAMPSFPDKGSNDSGVHTPLSAQSSASSIETSDKEETIRMKIDGTTRQRQDEVRTTSPAINNTNNISLAVNINAPANGGIAVNDITRPGPVTTIGIEETAEKKNEKEASPNTERKEIANRYIGPRPELDPNAIHQPLEDDSGEKAINFSPSAASQPKPQHAQEQDQGSRAKVMLDSGEADLQDLGS